MKFKNEAERLELIESFKQKAESLTQSMKSEIPEDTKVMFETVTDYDDPIEIDGEEGEKIIDIPGDIYVCYIKQPHIMTAVMILDKLNKRDSFGAGFAAWDSMVIAAPHSSKEIEKYRIKLGLVGRLGYLLDALRPDIKKN